MGCALGIRQEGISAFSTSSLNFSSFCLFPTPRICTHQPKTSQEPYHPSQRAFDGCLCQELSRTSVVERKGLHHMLPVTAGTDLCGGAQRAGSYAFGDSWH